MAALLEGLLCNMWVHSALLQNVESLKYPCSLRDGSNGLLFQVVLSNASLIEI